jgi:DNA-binding NarL/FixJ family response regulator
LRAAQLTQASSMTSAADSDQLTIQIGSNASFQVNVKAGDSLQTIASSINSAAGSGTPQNVREPHYATGSVAEEASLVLRDAAFRCVVADDHPAIVESVSRLLEETGEFDVVATAGDGVDALARIRELEPDVVVIDVDMPHLDGIEITRLLVADGAAPRILVYSGSRDPVVAQEVLEAGAAGYAVKGRPLSELVHAVNVVASGGMFVDAGIAARLTGPKSERPPLLTRREREVLRLMAEGLRNDEIAEQLELSPFTVRSHLKHAMEKLKASTRTEAVATAIRLSLVR